MRKNINKPTTRSIFGSMVVVLAIALIVLQACSTSDDPTIGVPTVDKFTLYTDQAVPTPNAGPVGSAVKITGTYFSEKGKNTVKFNGVEATVVTDKTSATSLTVIVPAGATTGKVSVENGGHTGVSTIDFTVPAGTPAPAIMKFSPGSANGIDSVEMTIDGFNFSATAANNTVMIDSISTGVPKKASATSLTVYVPPGTQKGKVWVVVTGSTAKAVSESDFTVSAPSIISFTPDKSIVGGSIGITGTNFSKKIVGNVVEFASGAGTVVGTVDSVSVKDAKANFIRVKVPAGVTKGKITVTVDGAKATAGSDFALN